MHLPLSCLIFPTCIGKPGAIFSTHVNIRQTSSCRDSARLCSPCGEVGTRSVSTVSPMTPLISCHWVLRVSLQKCANLVTVRADWRMRGTLVSPARIFVLLSSSLSMLSGEIYLRLKPYLVVKISSNIVTEHCCQACIKILSIMFCRSDCRLCAGMVSDCAICGNSPENHVVWLNSSRPTWDIKIFFTFDFHILH